jgi:hypothetical protein
MFREQGDDNRVDLGMNVRNTGQHRQYNSESILEMDSTSISFVQYNLKGNEKV